MHTERRVAPGVDLWHSTGSTGEVRILPDGCLDLILLRDRLVVAGPDTLARVHRGDGGPATGVRLHAGRGPALLGVPAHELRDDVVALEDLWGARRARLLRDQVLSAPAEALASWAVSVEPDPLGGRVRSMLARGQAVAAVASATGYSARQLGRRCLPLFGYGPQHLRRVLRLLRAVERGDAGLPWSRVAARSGYADQSHLVRDVRALTGRTPGELRAERVRSWQDQEPSRFVGSPS